MPVSRGDDQPDCGRSPCRLARAKESHGGREIRGRMGKERSIYHMQADKPRGIDGRRKCDERREGEMPVAQRVGVTRGRYAGAGQRNWDLKRANH
jgi:hypothetical protein